MRSRFIIAVFLVIALAPAAVWGANRTAVWLAAAAAALCLLAAIRPRAEAGFAAALWLGGLVWIAVHGHFWSVRPDESVRALARLCYFSAVFAIAADIRRGGRDPGEVLRAVAAWCASLTALGVVAEIAGRDLLPGAREAYPQAVEATFVNRNAFALYAGLGAIAAASALMRSRLGRGARRTTALCLLVCLAGVVASGSRGGACATAVGFAALFAVSGRWRLVAASVAAGGGAGALAHVARSGVPVEEERFVVYRILAERIAARPLDGVGFGAFQDGFRPFAAATWRWGDWDHAHNMYLETAFEIGVPAATAMVAALSVVAARAGRRASRRRRDAASACAFAAASAAGAHAMIDLSLAVPAVAALFACLLGLGSASRGEELDQKRSQRSAA